MEKQLFYICMGLLFLLVFILIVILIKNMSTTRDINHLHKEMQDLQNTIRSDLNILNQNNNTQFLQMSDAMHQQFYQSLQSTNKVFDEVLEKMVKIDESQNQMQDLSVDIKQLHTILNDKKTRGIYGEVELYSILERNYGSDTNFFRKQVTLSNGKMVDAVVYFQDEMLPIDSKFPLEHFNKMFDETLSLAERKNNENSFRQDVKKHINDIYRKYVCSDDTSDFAYMFIPAEAIYSYIYANLEDVVEYSYDMKVYIVSPTTLNAYITAMKSIYIGQKKNEKMHEMQEELNRLKVEFDRFKTRYEQVEKDFDKVGKDMQDVLVTAKKITTRFQKIEQVDFTD